MFIFFVNGFNILIDPYGYQSRDDKFLKNLTMFNKPHVTNARINSDGFYYLIGSSRTSRVNPQVIENITGKPTHNIKIDGATFHENAFLASKVKSKKKFYIYSFDVFSINSSRSKFFEIDSRYQSYKKSVNKEILFDKYYNSDITLRSLQHLIKTLKKENTNYGGCG